jgi:hypothetical protein
MATDLPYAAEAEITLSPDELEVSSTAPIGWYTAEQSKGPEETVLPRNRAGTCEHPIEIQLRSVWVVPLVVGQ